MSVAPSAVPSFSATDIRPSRERQVTSRTAWRRDLPKAPPVAANDNEPPISRPAPAKRELRIEPLLEWTYRRQKAHSILHEAMDWICWAMDRAGYVTNPLDHRKVHFDAVLVHEAVLALGAEAAASIVADALTSDWPELIDDSDPHFYPIDPADRYDDHGWYTDADGRRREYLIRTAETISITREEYELAGRKKMRRAKIESEEKVPVKYCPVICDPDPEFVEANGRRVASWQARKWVLAAALGQAPFHEHVLAPDALVAANDNAPLAANDNEPDQAAAFG
jgi:hypothetical protein